MKRIRIFGTLLLVAVGLIGGYSFKSAPHKKGKFTITKVGLTFVHSPCNNTSNLSLPTGSVIDESGKNEGTDYNCNQATQICTVEVAGGFPAPQNGNYILQAGTYSVECGAFQQ
jgi:hypothetical protein